MLPLLFMDNKAETRTLQVVVVYLFYYYKVILYYCNNVNGIVDMIRVKDCLITVALRLIILTSQRQNTEVLLTIKVATKLQCDIQLNVLSKPEQRQDNLWHGVDMNINYMVIFINFQFSKLRIFRNT